MSRHPLWEALRGELHHLERLVSGPQEESSQPVAVDDLVREAALLCSLQGAPVAVEASRTTVVSRPTEVRRVVQNLLANAQRHGVGPIEVAVRSRASDVEISVTDNGPEISPTVAARIFDAGVTRDPARGGGLGLYVSRRLARDLHGDLTVPSGSGRATFALSLPGGGELDHPGSAGLRGLG
ncbi:sensor histidine kinase [Nocardioides coralli]|uniref:sensor histidine kinase n=1 Tax=Nocardioides coralli TaxID=2872154 RepID=UPI003D2C32FF